MLHDNVGHSCNIIHDISVLYSVPVSNYQRIFCPSNNRSDIFELLSSPKPGSISISYSLSLYWARPVQVETVSVSHCNYVFYIMYY